MRTALDTTTTRRVLETRSEKLVRDLVYIAKAAADYGVALRQEDLRETIDDILRLATILAQGLQERVVSSKYQVLVAPPNMAYDDQWMAVEEGSVAPHSVIYCTVQVGLKLTSKIGQGSSTKREESIVEKPKVLTSGCVTGLTRSHNVSPAIRSYQTSKPQVGSGRSKGERAEKHRIDTVTGAGGGSRCDPQFRRR